MTEKISSNPDFVPEKPGTVCIATDRTGHYTPPEENALRFIQEGDVREKIHRFIEDNVMATACHTYIPDVTMLVFRLNSLKDLPLPKDGESTEHYIRNSLLRYIASENILPEKKISLADAVYSAMTRKEADCSMLNGCFMHETAYTEFIREQRMRKEIYRMQPEYVLPLTIVENAGGYLLFSGNDVGREGLRACIQHIADHYFDPHCDFGYLKIYECDEIKGNMQEIIDTSYSDHRYLPVMGHDFSHNRYVSPERLPDDVRERLRKVCEHTLKPDADGFRSFISHFNGNEATRTVVSKENHDIYRLLNIARCGYMNIHEKPFTYFETLLPLARKLERITQVKSAEQFNADDFRIHSLAIGRQAEAILHREFDVRGHRSVINELCDGNLEFRIGSVKLNSVQRAALADGYSVYLQENDRNGKKSLVYCMADTMSNTLKTSSAPFRNVPTYRMTEDGLMVRMDTAGKDKTRKGRKENTDKKRLKI